MMKKEEKEQSKGSVGQIIVMLFFIAVGACAGVLMAKYLDTRNPDRKPDAGHGKRKTEKEKTVGCGNRRAVPDGTSADEERDVSLCTL